MEKKGLDMVIFLFFNFNSGSNNIEILYRLLGVVMFIIIFFFVFIKIGKE